MLRIATEPGDAQIMIDGKLKGNSPSEAGQSFAIKLDEGEHTVSAVKPNGLKEHFGEKKIFVADDTMQTITLKLEERASESAKQAMADYVPNPEMVAVPAGKFVMGCQGNDQICLDDEKPTINMNVSAFEIGKYEVTFEMWDACYAQGGCTHYPADEGWGRGNRPVINVSWDDIQEFLAWINQKTGKEYRLPTEPEWEYAARAGTTTVYSWGDEIGQNNANCDGCGSQWDNKQTAPVGSFAANPWGIYDMHGNVSEWVSGCKWSYQDSAADTEASSWANSKSGKCDDTGRVHRGGSWFSGHPGYVRAAFRIGDSSENRFMSKGFRLARTN
jgi:formylglycine-generating enzyme required for sulfatase activity